MRNIVMVLVWTTICGQVSYICLLFSYDYAPVLFYCIFLSVTQWAMEDLTRSVLFFIVDDFSFYFVSSSISLDSMTSYGIE